MLRKLTTKNSEQTMSIGSKIGSRLLGGEMIELVSDVGGGKTTFVRGLALGAGSADHVSSPTFTVSNLYKAKKCDIYHMDLYRLHEAGLIEHELHDVLDDKNAVIVIEWSDALKHVLPEKRLTIHITTLGDESRQLAFNFPESLEYLVQDL